MVDLRLIVTNDLFSAFSSAPTSWGRLAGAGALAALVDDLRSEAKVAWWIDGGDFSGGYYAAHSDGSLGWEAAAALGIDVAVPGNHEFDFGDAAVLDHARSSGIALTSLDVAREERFADAAREDGGPVIAPRTVLAASDGGPVVGVVGMTLVERRGRAVYASLSADLRTSTAVLAEACEDLKADGEVDLVVAVVHDGIGLHAGILAEAMERDRIATLCGALRGRADVVVGGHSLGRCVGVVAGVPYLQPWALGAEVAVLDLTARGPRIATFANTGEAPWRGPGSALDRELEHTIVGQLATPLETPGFESRTSLAQATAEGILRVADVDAAVVTAVDAGCMQVALDGRWAHLEAGPVTERDVWRALPWPRGELGDGLVAADVSAGELERLAATLGWPGVRGGLAVRAAGGGGAAAVSRNYQQAATEALGRDPGWSALPVEQRDGLRAWVQR